MTTSSSFPFTLKNTGWFFRRFLLFVLCSGLVGGLASAQDGGIDPTFDTSFTTFGNIQSLKGVFVIVPQADGKILVGGTFTVLGGRARFAIARLNPDGTADTTFDSRLGLSNKVDRLFADPQGRILIRGSFQQVEGIARPGFARLRSDGTLDASFTPPRNVQDFALDQLGRIYVTGGAITDGSITRQGIARLNPDGSIDSGFTASTQPNALIIKALIDPQNRIVILGDFNTSNGVVRRGVIRLNSDGTTDSTFTPFLNLKGAEPSPGDFLLAIDPIGRILLAPAYSTSNRILRLNPNGTTDSGFTPPALGSIKTIAFQPSGKIVLGQNFFPGTSTFSRLNSDGTLDSTFISPQLGGTVNALSIDSTGRVLYGGNLGSITNAPLQTGDLGRLNVDGIFDQTFLVNNQEPGGVGSFVTDTNGRIIVGGSFSSCGVYPIPALARINQNGTVDTAFRPLRLPAQAPFAPPSVSSVVLEPGGKILVAGSFSEIAGTPRNRVARLNSDGSIDPTFNSAGPGELPPLGLLKIARDASGKIYIGGTFDTYSGVSRPGLARLNSDGSLDTSFIPGTTGSRLFDLDSSGRVVVVNDSSVTRLNPDGSVDNTFSTPIVPGFAMKVIGLAENKILIGGVFRFSGGPLESKLLRLNPDGSVDADFTAGLSSGDSINTFFTDAGGKFLISEAGPTSTAGRIIRLNPDGSRDQGFQPIEGFSPTAAGFDKDGKNLLAINFGVNEGRPRTGIVRLVTNNCRENVTPPRASFAASGGTGTITFTTPTNACPWRAETNTPWISISTAGTGSASISYSVSPNRSGVRIGYIRINRQIVTVTQEAGCTFSVTPSLTIYEEMGGQGTFDISCDNNCIWEIGDVSPWIRILGPTQGQGNATVQYQVLPNPGGIRGNTILIGGSPLLSIVQRGRRVSTPGSYRNTNGFAYLRNSTDTGFADLDFFYGAANDVPVAGDWDGNGEDSIGVFRDGVFFLKNANGTGFADIQFAFGQAGDIPIVGDWNGDGVDTVGVVRGNRILLRNSNTEGPADIDFTYGSPSDIFIAGDWNGDGIDTIGALRPSNGFVYLRNANSTGFADIEFFYGIAGDRPVAGDWDGDGIDTIGVVRGNTWFLRNSNSTGFADIQFVYGNPGDVPVVGDWDGRP